MRFATLLLVLMALSCSVSLGTTTQQAQLPPTDPVGPDLVIERANTCTFKQGPGVWFFTGYVICIEVVITNQGDIPSVPTHLRVVLTVEFRPPWVDPPVPEQDLQNIGAPTHFRAQYTAAVPALKPGQVVYIPHVIMPILGGPGSLPTDPWPGGSLPYPPNRLVATVDPYKRVPESDETNNTYTFRVSTYCGECSQSEERRCKGYGPFF